MTSPCRIIFLFSGAGAALAQTAGLVSGIAGSGPTPVVGTIVTATNPESTLHQRPVGRYSVATVQFGFTIEPGAVTGTVEGRPPPPYSIPAG